MTYEPFDFQSPRMWDWAMGMAQHVATASKDPSTKVGAVIFDEQRRIVSAGYNGFPRGVRDTSERLHDRPTKYKMTRHAEENALAFAVGSTRGATMFVTHPPCAQCAGAIIQAGVRHLCYPADKREELKERWGEDFDIANRMFSEAGVVVHAK